LRRSSRWDVAEGNVMLQSYPVVSTSIAAIWLAGWDSAIMHILQRTQSKRYTS
jgi:hypothetical protein